MVRCMNELTDDDFKTIIARRDRRYDGRFYFGVKTTSIYCRPVCPARPKPENIVIFRSLSEAEKNGYRPCLRCRPDAAPGSKLLDGTMNTVSRALRIVQDTDGDELSLQTYESPVGLLYLVGHGDKLGAIVFTPPERFGDLAADETPVLKETKRQLDEYFAGARREFDLPLELTGTDFQKKVWNALRHVPYGETTSYKEQAAIIAAPTAMRAVGRTNGLNLLSIVLPCHRVVGSTGALMGYAGGLEAKSFLLRLERGICGRRNRSG